MKRVLSFLILVCGIFISSTSGASGITYGSEDTQAATNSPWVVLILHYPINESNPDYFCSGTLIKTNTVLTAGHCVEPTGRFEVKYGITTFNEEGKSYSVSGAWRSPRYSAARYGVSDIGLLKLKESIPGAQVVALGSPATVLKAESSKEFKLFGWGVDQNGEVATYLRVTTITNQTSFLKKILGKYFNSNTWLAAGRVIPKEKVYSGGCSGDSGGPLMAFVSGKYIQVGITSFGAQDCDTSNPTIFMRLSYYLKDLATGIQQLNTNAVLVDRSLPENLVDPSISGTAEVGGTISCNPGKWSQNAKTIEISWSVDGGNEISKSSTLQVNKDMAGLEIQCKISALSSAGTVSVVAKTIIDRSLPNPIVQPSIVGVARVLNILTCSTGTWNKFATSLKVTWSTDGGFGTSSSGNTFLVPEDAAGKTVNCEVTGTGLAGSTTVKASVQIPAKPQITGSVSIVGLPTSGYSAGNGITVQCSGATASGAIESSETVWYLRDYATGTPTTKVATGSQYSLPNDFFQQNQGRVLICGFSALGPGGMATSFDVKSIVAPRLPDVPNVTLTGFTTSGSNADAWINLPITCKVDSYFDSSISRTISINWRIYDSSAPYYPVITTPSTSIGTGPVLVLTKAILDQAVLKSIGCAATVTTASGSSTGFSSKTYVNYQNLVLADNTPPSVSVIQMPDAGLLKLGSSISFTVLVTDDVGLGTYPISGIKLISPNNTEVPSTGGFLPSKISGSSTSANYAVNVALPTKASGATAGTYKLLLSVWDAKNNGTGWITVSTFSVTE